MKQSVVLTSHCETTVYWMLKIKYNAFDVCWRPRASAIQDHQWNWRSNIQACTVLESTYTCFSPNCYEFVCLRIVMSFFKLGWRWWAAAAASFIGRRRRRREMPAEPSKGGTVECKQCYRAAGQQARVQIEVHFVIDTCAIWYICNIQSNASSV